MENNLNKNQTLDDIFAEENEKNEAAVAPEVVEKNNLPQERRVINYENDSNFFDKIRGSMKYIILILVIVIVGALVFLFREKIISLVSKAKPTENVEIEKNNALNQQEEEKSENITQNPQKIVANNEREKDPDGDGLSNQEENQFGTNSEMADSDNDGLYDREEIKIFKTNPLNSDTDGDGFTDGKEVKAKKNPRGTGDLSMMK